MARPEIFRKVALDRLSSPEQLDQMMQVSNPRGWLALASMGVLLGAVLAWSVLGTIPERVPGQGILLQSGGVFEVVSQSGGRVVDLPVRVGDLISEGQVIARLAQPELTEQLRLARERVAELMRQADQVEALARRDLALKVEALDRRRANVREAIRAGEAIVSHLGGRIESQERLVERGLTTRQALLATRQEFEQASERVRTSRAELVQLEFEQAQAESQMQQQLLNGRNQVLEAERELVRIEGDLQLQSAVTTPYSGRVLEVMTQQGSIADRGAPILTVSLVGKAVKNLEAVVYIPSAHGKKVREGMTIEIVPSTVKREVYGYLIGRVTYVSDFPATPEGMQRMLKNSRLAETLSGQDAPYEVHADLIPDPSNPSGYAWSSSTGPNTGLQSGTVATAQVVVSELRPILMVLPQLRRALPSPGDEQPLAAGRPDGS